mgnify:CR=1 FL=1
MNLKIYSLGYGKKGDNIMGLEWNNVKPACCAKWLVLPTVYSDALSYGEQLDKFCYQLNQLIENNNILPDFIAEMIKEYINSGAIGEVVRDILADYILNVKYPPKGIKPAVGDGSADDTEAIQGCIDYASNNGGVVYFPYGSYLTQSLTMKDGVSLFGFDRYSAKIVLKGGATKPLIGGTVARLSIANLTLDGNSSIQVNDVNVVTVMATDMLMTNLIIKDGYTLVNYYGTGGHLQISDVVFGNAVEKCLLTAGNANVQAENLIFNQLSAVGGICVIDIGTDDGYFNVKSVAKCDKCISVSGNNNHIVAIVNNSKTPLTDSGLKNNVVISGYSVSTYNARNYKLKVDGETNVELKNTTTNIDGDFEVGVNGNSTLNLKNTTHNIDGDFEVGVNGNSTLNLKNTTHNIDGDFEVGVNGNSTLNLKNTTHNIDGDFNITAKNINVNAQVSVNNFYNALGYGFKNDGVSDNLNVFNKFVSEHNNCVLYFPAGDYLINGFIDINKNIHLIGNNATLLAGTSKGDDLTALITFHKPAFVYGLSIDGKKLDENKWGETDRNNLKLISGFQFNDNAKIVKCDFKNFWGDGVFVCGEKSLISDCYFNVGGKWHVNDTYDHFGDAIYVKSKAKNVSIYNCNLDMLHSTSTNSRAGIVVEYVEQKVCVRLNGCKINYANRGIHVENTDTCYLLINSCDFSSCDAQIFNWQNTNKTRVCCINTIFTPTGNDYNGQYGVNLSVCNFTNCRINKGKTFFRDLIHSTFNNCFIVVGELEIINSNAVFNNCEFDFNNVYLDFNYGSEIILNNCLLTSENVKYINNSKILLCCECELNEVIFNKMLSKYSKLKLKEGDNYNYSSGSETFEMIIDDNVYKPTLLNTMPYDINYNPYDVITLNISDGSEHNFKNMLKVKKDSVYLCIVIGGEVETIAGRGTKGGYYFKVTTDSSKNITGSTAKLDVRGANFDLTVNGENFTVKRGQYSTYAHILILPYHYLNDSGLI